MAGQAFRCLEASQVLKDVYALCVNNAEGFQDSWKTRHKR